MARDKNSLSDYLRSLYGIEPLPLQEEIELARRIQAGDEDALDRLVTHNLRFVVSILKELPTWHHGTIELEDLVGYGNFWLLHAAKKWIPSNGARFATYAKPFILKGVRRDVDNTSNLIRLPVNVSEELRRMQYQERHMTQELGREPRACELAQRLEISESRLYQLRGYLLREPTSLESFNQEHMSEESEE
jgi:RNA polymerase primary sigma factor